VRAWSSALCLPPIHSDPRPFSSTEPHFFAQHGYDLETKLVELLGEHGFLSSPASEPPPPAPAPGQQERVHPVIVQCFDPATLRSLAVRVPGVPLVQLLIAPTTEGEGIAHHLGREAVYGQLPLADIADYAHGIGPQKTVYTSLPPDMARAQVDRAHALGLGVHPWTFRREARFVDKVFKHGSDQELLFFYECLVGQPNASRALDT
jgi:glycerophosphoryl diester phosphodiesterase